MTGSDRLTIAAERLNEISAEKLTDAEAVQYAQAVGLVELAAVLRGLAPVVSNAMKDESASNEIRAAIAASLKQIEGTLDLDYTKRHRESPGETARRNTVRQSSQPDLASYVSGDDDASP